MLTKTQDANPDSIWEVTPTEREEFWEQLYAKPGKNPSGTIPYSQAPLIYFNYTQGIAMATRNLTAGSLGHIG